MEKTVIKKCTCKDEDQDKLYGQGNRLHNVSSLPGRKECYCTVCSPSQRKLRIGATQYPVPHHLRKSKPL